MICGALFFSVKHRSVGMLGDARREGTTNVNGDDGALNDDDDDGDDDKIDDDTEDEIEEKDVAVTFEAVDHGRG